jgi:predicted nucleotidyltransferase
MFTVLDRERLKDRLFAAAGDDERVGAAATFGSTAAGTEDRWSDIDLALELAPGVSRDAVMADWTEEMYAQHSAAHHFDVRATDAVYRVFLLSNALQVDISFWPAGSLRSSGARFRLLFGSVASTPPSPPPDANELIGRGWLYALHGRSSIERERVWQAEYMISVARNHVLALACVRHNLPAREGRGMDDLPGEVTASLADTLVGSTDRETLRRALAAVANALLAEINYFDSALAERVITPLRELTLPS